MNDTWLYYLIVVPIVVFFGWLRFKEIFGPKRIEPVRDGIGMAVLLVYLVAFFMATVFEHPEARIGWFAGVLCGVAIGLFDLRVTRIRNAAGGILAYTSRLVTLLFLVAGELWSASHGGRRDITFDDATSDPAAMFFCTTLLTYVVVFFNGIYSGRRFESVNPPRKAAERSSTTIEYGRRRGRR